MWNLADSRRYPPPHRKVLNVSLIDVAFITANPKEVDHGEKKVERRDQAGLPQPDRASLLASAGGARHTLADFEDLQDNQIVALDPSQEADEALTRSSKAVVHSSSTDSEDSDPMARDFDNEVLEALAHLDHAQGLLLLPSARFTHSVFI